MATDQDLADQAQSLIAAANNQYQRIRNNQDASPASVQKQIAMTYLKTRDQVTALSNQFSQVPQNQAARAEDLARQLYGITNPNDPYAVIAFRDANDRVARIEGPNIFDRGRIANDMLNTAFVTQDTVLARALLAGAFTYGWQDVVETYIEHKPGTRGDIDELITLTKMAGRKSSLNALFNFAVPRPAELAGASDEYLQQLIGG